MFLGEHIALVDFMKVLQRRGFLINGEYAVVAVDDEIYDPSTAAFTLDYTGKFIPIDFGVSCFLAVTYLCTKFNS